jgi:hypothetical protein
MVRVSKRHFCQQIRGLFIVAVIAGHIFSTLPSSRLSLRVGIYRELESADSRICLDLSVITLQSVPKTLSRQQILFWVLYRRTNSRYFLRMLSRFSLRLLSHPRQLSSKVFTSSLKITLRNVGANFPQIGGTNWRNTQITVFILATR